MENYLCIDVGGSSIKYGILDKNGEIVLSKKGRAPKSLLEMYNDFESVYKEFEKYKIHGIALSMPGAVDSDRGTIGGSSAYDYIHGPNIKKDLEKRLQLRVELENDANCAALAEVWKGAAKNVNDCCFVVSGTGIGGAVVKDKKIHKGKHLHGGEFGYMIAEFDFETKQMLTWSDLSTVNILKKIAKEKNLSIEDLNGEEVFDNYRYDKTYEKYIDKYYYAMAKGIYDLQYMYDPEMIVLGGAISARKDILNEIEMRLDVIFENITCAHIRPNIQKCQYQNNANLIGALYHYLTVKI